MAERTAIQGVDMKLDELLGAEVIAVQGEEGHGCEQCRIPPGRPEYDRMFLKLLDGAICELSVQGICPPDMDTGEREQRIVARIRGEVPLDNPKG